MAFFATLFFNPSSSKEAVEQKNEGPCQGKNALKKRYAVHLDLDHYFIFSSFYSF